MSFTIEPFMVNKLKLSGADLLVYAYLYEKGKGEGITTTMSRWYRECGAGSLSTVSRTLIKLVEKGYIEMEKVGKGNQSYMNYVCVEKYNRKEK